MVAVAKSPLTTNESKIDLAALKAELREHLTPQERKAQEQENLIGELFDLIADLLRRGESKRTILEMLKRHGLILTYAEFAKLLGAEANRRGVPVPGQDESSMDQTPLSGQADNHLNEAA